MLTFLALSAARLFLAAALIVAGTMKVADLPAFRMNMERFGLPCAGFIAGAVPVLELALGIGVLLDVSARAAAAASALLLALFTGLLIWARQRDSEAECHCFGSLPVATSGRAAILRNTTLMAGAMAIVLLAGRDLRPLIPVTLLENLAPIGLTVVIATVALLIDTRIKFNRLTARVDNLAGSVEQKDALWPQGAPDRGLAPGTPAPGFSLPDTNGSPRSLESLLKIYQRVALVFVGVNCGPCERLLPKLEQFSLTIQPSGSLVLIAQGPSSTLRAWATRYQIRYVLLDSRREVAQRFGAYGTPSAVLIDKQARIDSRLAAGTREVEALLARISDGASNMDSLSVASEPSPTKRSEKSPARDAGLPPLRIGDSISSVPLIDTAGQQLFIEESMLVIFLSEECFNCAPLLKLTASSAQDGKVHDRRLVLVVTDDSILAGSPLNGSFIVLDPDFDVGRRFGVPGTPAALAVDATGVVASPVASGAAAIAALAGLKLDSFR